MTTGETQVSCLSHIGIGLFGTSGSSRSNADATAGRLSYIAFHNAFTQSVIAVIHGNGADLGRLFTKSLETGFSGTITGAVAGLSSL